MTKELTVYEVEARVYYTEGGERKEWRTVVQAANRFHAMTLLRRNMVADGLGDMRDGFSVVFFVMEGDEVPTGDFKTPIWINPRLKEHKDDVSDPR